MSLKKLFLLLVIAGLIGGGVYVANYQPELLPPQLTSLTPQASSGLVQGVSTLQDQVDQIKEKQIKPLGAKIEESRLISVDENNPRPIHEKAFEYARYEYCKQVVKDFESAE